MERKIVDYCRELTITNIDALPRGTGSGLLLAVESIYAGEYIAKRWLRKLPATMGRCEVVIRFGSVSGVTK